MRAPALAAAIFICALCNGALCDGALTAWAQSAPPQEFTTVEVVGWDVSAFDEKVREAVSKANAPGAGEAARRAAGAALAERANFFRDAGNPVFYKYALGDFRHALRFRPDDAESRERAGEIVSIYEAMRRPVPTNGELKTGGLYLVEVYRTTPQRLTFESGKAHIGEMYLSDRAAFVYEFEALAGQELSVVLKPKGEGVAVFDLLHATGDGRPLVRGAKQKRYLLPSEGKYLLRVRSKEGVAGYELNAELR